MNKLISKIRLISILVFACILVIILVAATNEKPILVSYYGEKVDLRQLESHNKTLGCDDHLGRGILTCYNTFEEMLEANKCTTGVYRGEILCEPDILTSSEKDISDRVTEISPNGTLYTVLWDDIYYEGNWRSLSQDYNDLRSINFNDRTSSVTIYSSATLFEHMNYYGDKIQLSFSVDDLRNYNFNDVTSSVARGFH